MTPLEDPKIEYLLARLDELVRWRPGAAGQYHDPHGALRRIQGKANHLVLGRRGSGKTRLLDELQRAGVAEDILVVTIGAEDYKELTYPDILIQILRSFLRKFADLLDPKPFPLTKSWWEKKVRWMKSPVKYLRERQIQNKLIQEVGVISSELDELFSESEEIAVELEQSREHLEKASEEDGSELSVSVSGSGGKVSSRTSMLDERTTGKTRRITQSETKKTKVERLLGDFKHLLAGICSLKKVSLFLAVDDFYFIKRTDQPHVIDYVHRICKDTSAFLKIATIKHRSHLLHQGEVVRGVVKGHEIQSIDLELPLGQFDSVQRFLYAIWGAVCEEIGIADANELFKGDGLPQAVLASGGVPRDFFGIIKLALSIARERNEAAVGKLRINEAARQYAEETKIPELSVDAPNTERLTELLLFDVVRFARDIKKKNCLHIDLDKLKEHQEMHRLIDSLVDARLLHLITDNTTNARQSGRYAAYLLDVGLYAHPQRRGERAIDEVKFWERDDIGRLTHLARSPVFPLRSLADLREGVAKIADEGLEMSKELLLGDVEEETEDQKQLSLAFLPLVEEVQDLA